MYLKNLRVPIPEGSRTTKAGLVQHKLTVKDSGEQKWITIGKLPPEGAAFDDEDNPLMVPNGIYRYCFRLYYLGVVRKDPDHIPPFFSEGAKIGTFALFLGAVTKSGLYDILIDVFGIVTANALLDLAMFYNIEERLELDPPDWLTEGQIVFSVRPHTPEWYMKRINDLEDEQIDAFMQRWTKRRQRAVRGGTSIHLDASREPLPQMYYSDPEEYSALTVCENGGAYPGLPLAYDLRYTGTPDDLDAEIAMDSFQELGLKPKRVIGGLSPLKPAFFAMCEEIQKPWLLKLEPTFLAFEDMLSRHEEDLFQGRGTPIAAREPMVAASEDDVLLFGPETLDPDRRSFVALYCISRPARESRAFLQDCVDKAYPEACAVLEKLQNSSEKDKLPIPDPAKAAGREDEDEVSAEDQARNILFQAAWQAGGGHSFPDPRGWNCLKLVYHPEEGKYQVAVDDVELRYSRCKGSYIAMAASEPMDLQEISDAFPLSYFLGDGMFATTFSAMHAQLNIPAPDDGIMDPWFFTAYIADIVRALLMPSFQAFAAEKDGELLDAARKELSEEERKEREPRVFLCYGEMFHWLDDLRFVRRYIDGPLEYTGSTEGVRGAVLAAAGIKPSYLHRFYDLVNAAEDPTALRVLRHEKRSVQKRRSTQAGTQDTPTQDTDNG